MRSDLPFTYSPAPGRVGTGKSFLNEGRGKQEMEQLRKRRRIHF